MAFTDRSQALLEALNQLSTALQEVEGRVTETNNKFSQFEGSAYRVGEVAQSVVQLREALNLLTPQNIKNLRENIENANAELGKLDTLTVQRLAEQLRSVYDHSRSIALSAGEVKQQYDQIVRLTSAIVQSGKEIDSTYSQLENHGMQVSQSYREALNGLDSLLDKIKQSGSIPEMLKGLRPVTYEKSAVAIEALYQSLFKIQSLSPKGSSNNAALQYISSLGTAAKEAYPNINKLVAAMYAFQQANQGTFSDKMRSSFAAKSSGTVADTQAATKSSTADLDTNSFVSIVKTLNASMERLASLEQRLSHAEIPSQETTQAPKRRTKVTTSSATVPEDTSEVTSVAPPPKVKTPRVKKEPELIYTKEDYDNAPNVELPKPRAVQDQLAIINRLLLAMGTEPIPAQVERTKEIVEIFRNNPTYRSQLVSTPDDPHHAKKQELNEKVSALFTSINPSIAALMDQRMSARFDNADILSKAVVGKSTLTAELSKILSQVMSADKVKQTIENFYHKAAVTPINNSTISGKPSGSSLSALITSEITSLPEQMRKIIENDLIKVLGNAKVSYQGSDPRGIREVSDDMYRARYQRYTQLKAAFDQFPESHLATSLPKEFGPDFAITTQDKLTAARASLDPNNIGSEVTQQVHKYMYQKLHEVDTAIIEMLQPSHARVYALLRNLDIRNRTSDVIDHSNEATTMEAGYQYDPLTREHYTVPDRSLKADDARKIANIQAMRAATDASPHGIAVVGTSGASPIGASLLNENDRSSDHILVVRKTEEGAYHVLESMVNEPDVDSFKKAFGEPLASQRRTLSQVAEANAVSAVPLMFGDSSKINEFMASLEHLTSPASNIPYSFSTIEQNGMLAGLTCSEAFLEAANNTVLNNAKEHTQYRDLGKLTRLNLTTPEEMYQAVVRGNMMQEAGQNGSDSMLGQSQHWISRLAGFFDNAFSGIVSRIRETFSDIASTFKDLRVGDIFKDFVDGTKDVNTVTGNVEPDYAIRAFEDKLGRIITPKESRASSEFSPQVEFELGKFGFTQGLKHRLGLNMVSPKTMDRVQNFLGTPTTGVLGTHIEPPTNATSKKHYVAVSSDSTNYEGTNQGPGVLIHELVHAQDFAKGSIHRFDEKNGIHRFQDPDLDDMVMSALFDKMMGSLSVNRFKTNPLRIPGKPSILKNFLGRLATGNDKHSYMFDSKEMLAFTGQALGYEDKDAQRGLSSYYGDSLFNVISKVLSTHVSEVFKDSNIKDLRNALQNLHDPMERTAAKISSPDYAVTPYDNYIERLMSPAEAEASNYLTGYAHNTLSRFGLTQSLSGFRSITMLGQQNLSALEGNISGSISTPVPHGISFGEGVKGTSDRTNYVAINRAAQNVYGTNLIPSALLHELIHAKDSSTNHGQYYDRNEKADRFQDRELDSMVRGRLYELLANQKNTLMPLAYQLKGNNASLDTVALMAGIATNPKQLRYLFNSSEMLAFTGQALGTGDIHKQDMLSNLYGTHLFDRMYDILARRMPEAFAGNNVYDLQAALMDLHHPTNQMATHIAQNADYFISPEQTNAMRSFSKSYYRPFTYGLSQVGAIMNAGIEIGKGNQVGGPAGFIDQLGGVFKALHSLQNLNYFFNLGLLPKGLDRFNLKRSQTLMDIAEFAVGMQTGYGRTPADKRLPELTLKETKLSDRAEFLQSILQDENINPQRRQEAEIELSNIKENLKDTRSLINAYRRVRVFEEESAKEREQKNRPSSGKIAESDITATTGSVVPPTSIPSSESKPTEAYQSYKELVRRYQAAGTPVPTNVAKLMEVSQAEAESRKLPFYLNDEERNTSVIKGIKRTLVQQMSEGSVQDFDKKSAVLTNIESIYKEVSAQLRRYFEKGIAVDLPILYKPVAEMTDEDKAKSDITRAMLKMFGYDLSSGVLMKTTGTPSADFSVVSDSLHSTVKPYTSDKDILTAQALHAAMSMFEEFGLNQNLKDPSSFIYTSTAGMNALHKRVYGKELPEDMSVSMMRFDAQKEHFVALDNSKMVNSAPEGFASPINTMVHEAIHTVMSTLNPNSGISLKDGALQFNDEETQLNKLIRASNVDNDEGTRKNLTDFINSQPENSASSFLMKHILENKQLSEYMFKPTEMLAYTGQSIASNDEGLQSMLKSLYGEELFSRMQAMLVKSMPEAFSPENLPKFQKRIADQANITNAIATGKLNEAQLKAYTADPNAFDATKAPSVDDILDEHIVKPIQHFISKLKTEGWTISETLQKFSMSDAGKLVKDSLIATIDKPIKDFLVDTVYAEIGMKNFFDDFKKVFDLTPDLLANFFASIPENYLVRDSATEIGYRSVKEAAPEGTTRTLFKAILSPTEENRNAALEAFRQIDIGDVIENYISNSVGIRRDESLLSVGTKVLRGQVPLKTAVGAMQLEGLPQLGVKPMSTVELASSIIRYLSPDTPNFRDKLNERIVQTTGYNIAPGSYQQQEVFDPRTGKSTYHISAMTRGGASVGATGELTGYGTQKLNFSQENSFVKDFVHQMSREIPQQLGQELFYSVYSRFMTIIQQVVQVQDELQEVVYLFNKAGEEGKQLKLNFLDSSVRTSIETGQGFEETLKTNIQNVKLLGSVQNDDDRLKLANRLSKLQLGAQTVFGISLEQSMQSVPAIMENIRDGITDISDPALKAQETAKRLEQVFNELTLAQRATGASGEDLITVYAALASSAKKYGMTSAELVTLTATSAVALGKGPEETQQSLKLMMERVYSNTGDLTNLGTAKDGSIAKIATQEFDPTSGIIKYRKFNDIVDDMYRFVTDDNTKHLAPKLYKEIGGMARAREVEQVIQGYGQKSDFTTSFMERNEGYSAFLDILSRKSMTVDKSMAALLATFAKVIAKFGESSGAIASLSTFLQSMIAMVDGLSSFFSEHSDLSKGLTWLLTTFLKFKAITFLQGNFDIFERISKSITTSVNPMNALFSRLTDFERVGDTTMTSFSRNTAMAEQALRSLANAVLEVQTNVNTLNGTPVQVKEAVAAGTANAAGATVAGEVASEAATVAAVTAAPKAEEVAEAHTAAVAAAVTNEVVSEAATVAAVVATPKEDVNHQVKQKVKGQRKLIEQEYDTFISGFSAGDYGKAELTEGENRATVRNRLKAAAARANLSLNFDRTKGSTLQFRVSSLESEAVDAVKNTKPESADFSLVSMERKSKLINKANAAQLQVLEALDPEDLKRVTEVHAETVKKQSKTIRARVANFFKGITTSMQSLSDKIGGDGLNAIKDVITDEGTRSSVTLQATADAMQQINRTSQKRSKFRQFMADHGDTIGTAAMTGMVSAGAQGFTPEATLRAGISTLAAGFIGVVGKSPMWAMAAYTFSDVVLAQLNLGQYFGITQQQRSSAAQAIVRVTDPSYGVKSTLDAQIEAKVVTDIEKNRKEFKIDTLKSELARYNVGNVTSDQYKAYLDAKSRGIDPGDFSSAGMSYMLNAGDIAQFDMIIRKINPKLADMYKESSLSSVGQLDELLKDPTFVGPMSEAFSQQLTESNQHLVNVDGTLKLIYGSAQELVAKAEEQLNELKSYRDSRTQIPYGLNKFGPFGEANLKLDAQFEGQLADIRSGKITGKEASKVLETYNLGKESLKNIPGILTMLKPSQVYLGQNLKGIEELLYKAGPEAQSDFSGKVSNINELYSFTAGYEDQVAMLNKLKESDYAKAKDEETLGQIAKLEKLLALDKDRYNVSKQYLDTIKKSSNFLLDQLNTSTKLSKTKHIVLQQATPAQFQAPSIMDVSDTSASDLNEAITYAKQKQATLEKMNPEYRKQFARSQFMMQSGMKFKGVTGVDQSFVNEYLSELKSKKANPPSVMDLSQYTDQQIQRAMDDAKKMQDQYYQLAPDQNGKYDDERLIIMRKNNDLLLKTGLGQEFLRQALDKNTKSTDELRGHYNVPANYRMPTVWDYYDQGGKETGEINFPNGKGKVSMDFALQLANEMYKGEGGKKNKTNLDDITGTTGPGARPLFYPDPGNPEVAIDIAVPDLEFTLSPTSIKVGESSITIRFKEMNNMDSFDDAGGSNVTDPTVGDKYKGSKPPPGVDPRFWEQNTTLPDAIAPDVTNKVAEAANLRANNRPNVRDEDPSSGVTTSNQNQLDPAILEAGKLDTLGGQVTKAINQITLADILSGLISGLYAGGLSPLPQDPAGYEELYNKYHPKVTSTNGAVNYQVGGQKDERNQLLRYYDQGKTMDYVSTNSLDHDQAGQSLSLLAKQALSDYESGNLKSTYQTVSDGNTVTASGADLLKFFNSIDVSTAAVNNLSKSATSANDALKTSGTSLAGASAGAVGAMTTATAGFSATNTIMNGIGTDAQKLIEALSAVSKAFSNFSIGKVLGNQKMQINLTLDGKNVTTMETKIIDNTTGAGGSRSTGTTPTTGKLNKL